MAGSSVRPRAVGASGHAVGARRAGLVGVVGAALLAVAGCAAEPEVEWPADPVPQSPRVDPAEAAAVDELLTLFDEYRRVELALAAEPVPAFEAEPEFTEYLADPLLSVALLELETLHRRGLVREGAPTWQPTVVDLRLDETPPVATIRDCLDTTDWRVTHPGGGSAALDGLPARFAPDRYVIEYQARFLAGRWLLADADVEEDGQC